MRTQRYAVMADCRTGTRSLIDGAWVDNWHVVTMRVEDTEEAATDYALALVSHENREIRAVWVNTIE